MMQCLIPKYYKDEVAYEIEWDRLENEMTDETQKPFINSGHAFVCFDSVASLNSIIKHFKITPM